MKTRTMGGITFQEDNDRLVLRVSWQGVLAPYWAMFVPIFLMLAYMFYAAGDSLGGFDFHRALSRTLPLLPIFGWLLLFLLGAFIHSVWQGRTPVLLDRRTRRVLRGQRHVCSFEDIVSLAPVYRNRIWHILLDLRHSKRVFLMPLPAVSTLQQQHLDAVQTIAKYLGVRPSPQPDRAGWISDQAKPAPLPEDTNRIPMASAKPVRIGGYAVGVGLTVVFGLALYAGISGHWDALLQTKGASGKNGFVQLAILMIGGIVVFLALLSGFKTEVVLSAEGIAVERWGRRKWLMPWSDYDGWQWDKNHKEEIAALRLWSKTGSQCRIPVPWVAQGLSPDRSFRYGPLVQVTEALRERAPDKGERAAPR